MIFAAVATSVSWQPERFAQTTATTQAMLAAYRRHAMPAGQRTVRLRLVEGSTTVDATALVRGGDYRIDELVDGAPYAFGRSAALRWRRTPAGVVRVIESDVQGDPLDRWPSGFFGFDQTACTAAGESQAHAAMQWVLACLAPGDLPRWIYLDPSDGRVVREVTREGARVVTYIFDERGWTATGFGGDARVDLVSATDGAIGRLDVAMPDSVSTGFALPDADPMDVPARFSGDTITVPVTIDGQGSNFVLDTGTTQMLVDYRITDRLGLRSVLGHTIAPTFAVGAARTSRLPFQTLDLGWAGVQGLLGNEFFIGHIVHIDYHNQRVSLQHRATFVPPAGAVAVLADYREGLPLIEAQANGLLGERFALDTGSPNILLTASYGERAGAKARGWLSRSGFLEGPVAVRWGSLDAFRFGMVKFDHPDTMVVQPDSDNLDIPLDGVIGTEALKHFEWWFDYDGSRLWMRPN